MAAVAIPIITAVAPSIIQLIAGLVHRSAPIQEATQGPKTGPVKFAGVFADVIQALTAAANAGQIDKVLPPDPAIQVIIQAVITSMQISGLLSGVPTATAQTATVAPQAQPAVGAPPNAAPLSFALKNGQILMISVA